MMAMLSAGARFFKLAAMAQPAAPPPTMTMSKLDVLMELIDLAFCVVVI